jgi:hypothetical protein
MVNCQLARCSNAIGGFWEANTRPAVASSSFVALLCGKAIHVLSFLFDVTGPVVQRECNPTCARATEINESRGSRSRVAEACS